MKNFYRLLIAVAIITLTKISVNAQNVGIGTAVPAQKLEIAGTTNTVRINGLLSGGKYNTPAGSTSNILFVNNTTGDVYALPSGGVGAILTLNTSGVPTWSTGATSATAWQLTGNAGTTAGTNFIGTTDANDFVFKTFSSERMRISSAGYVGINTAPVTTQQLTVVTSTTANSGMVGENTVASGIGNSGYGSVGLGSGGAISYSVVLATTPAVTLNMNSGVFGSAATGATVPTSGTSNVGFGVIGMLGTAFPTSSSTFVQGAGVLGTASSGGTAIAAYTSGGGVGVYASSTGGGIGVSVNTTGGGDGISVVSTGGAIGVLSSVSSTGTGVEGSATGNNGIGVEGISSSGGAALYGASSGSNGNGSGPTGGYGVFATGSTTTEAAVYGFLGSATETPKATIPAAVGAVYGQTSLAGAWALVANNSVSSTPTNNGLLVFGTTNSVGTLTLGQNVTTYMTGGVKANGSLVFDNNSTTNTVTINSGATTTSYPLTLPVAQGALNSVLYNADGAGTLAFSATGTAGQVLTIASGVPTWTTPSATSATAWQLTGNSGTTYGSNYIGTSDANNLMFKVNGSVAGRIEQYNLTLGLYGNTSLGDSAMYSNSSGYQNAAVGYQALSKNTSGYQDAAVGYRALYHNTSGTGNTAVGWEALDANTTSNNNSAFGTAALSNTTGTENSAFGFDALAGTTTGNYNTAFGENSLSANTTGNSSSALGRHSLENTTGSRNVGVGDSALYTNVTGTNNTALGYDADMSTSNLTNATVIGYQASALASNSITLGNTAVTSLYLPGYSTAGEMFYTSAASGLVAPLAIGSSGQVLTVIGGVPTWSTPTATSSTAWTLTGNAGTTAGTNFIGTTDATDLQFKTGTAPNLDMTIGGTFGDLGLIGINSAPVSSQRLTVLTSTTGTTGVVGTNTVASGTGNNGYGVAGEGSGGAIAYSVVLATTPAITLNMNSGVFGSAATGATVPTSGTSNVGFGVIGMLGTSFPTSSTTFIPGAGVLGTATSSGVGVAGYASGSSAIGVFGNATSTGTGVEGNATGNNGVGVYGYSNSGGAALYGKATGTNGNTSGPTGGYGVFATGSSNAEAAVYANLDGNSPTPSTTLPPVIGAVYGQTSLAGSWALVANNNVSSTPTNNGLLVFGTTNAVGSLTLGQNTTTYMTGGVKANGSLVFDNNSNTNAVTINAGATTASYPLTLPVTQGALNSVLYNADGAGTLAFSATGTSGQVLTIASGVPTWSSLATGVSSVGTTAPIYNTGTASASVIAIQGNTSGTDQGGILYSNGSGVSAAFNSTGTSGNILLSAGTSAPTWLGNGTTGQILTILSGVPTWSTPTATSSTAWTLTGNAGTTAGTNFIGTTDATDLQFKTGTSPNLDMTIGGTSGDLGLIGINSAPVSGQRLTVLTGTTSTSGVVGENTVTSGIGNNGYGTVGLGTGGAIAYQSIIAGPPTVTLNMNAGLFGSAAAGPSVPTSGTSNVGFGVVGMLGTALPTSASFPSAGVLGTATNGGTAVAAFASGNGTGVLANASGGGTGVNSSASGNTSSGYGGYGVEASASKGGTGVFAASSGANTATPAEGGYGVFATGTSNTQAAVYGYVGSGSPSGPNGTVIPAIGAIYGQTGTTGDWALIANNSSSTSTPSGNGLLVYGTTNAVGTLTLGQNVTTYMTGGVKANGSLVFDNNSNTNAVTINTGATTASYPLTLPVTQGALNSVLYNADGAGTLAFSATGTSGQVLTIASGVPTWSTPTSVSTTAWILAGNAVAYTPSATPATYLGTTSAGGTGFQFGVKGVNAGRVESTNGNTALGYQALNTSGSGVDNTAIGYQALKVSPTGAGTGYLTAVGYQALTANTTGWPNDAFGYEALSSNTSGSENVALGYGAEQYNTAGSENTAIGYQALADDGSNLSVAVGYQALQLAGSGTDNIAVGEEALNSNGGSQNVGVGSYTLYAGSGSNNSALGFSALGGSYFDNPLQGNNNTAVGTNAAYGIANGNNNTAVGYNSLQLGDNNDDVAVGANTNGSGTFLPTTGTSYDVAVGYGASQNLAGPGSTSSMGGGNANTVIGYQAMLGTPIGNFAYANTAVGYEALYNSSQNFGNTALGDSSLYNSSSTNYDVAVGFGALSNDNSGTNNTALGYLANVSVDGLTNATAIGYNAQAPTSNSITLGNTAVAYNAVAGSGLYLPGYATTGSLLYTSAASGLVAPLAIGSSGQVLTVTGGVPTWSTPTATSSTAWQLIGNAGTTAGTNFIGTTDSKDFVFKTFATERMRISSAGYAAINTAPVTTQQLTVNTSTTGNSGIVGSNTITAGTGVNGYGTVGLGTGGAIAYQSIIAGPPTVTLNMNAGLFGSAAAGPSVPTSGTSNVGFGVVGMLGTALPTSASFPSAGVLGTATNGGTAMAAFASGNGTGVLSNASGGGTGVNSSASGNTSSGYGGYGVEASASKGGTGVFAASSGANTATPAEGGYGVFATGTSNTQAAVYGYVGSGSPSGPNGTVIPAIGAIYGQTGTTGDWALIANNSSSTSTPSGNGLLVYGTTNAVGTLTLGQNVTTYMTGGVKANGSLIFDNNSNTNTVTFNTGATSASYTLTLPTAQASSAGEVLTNDGTGVLSWASPSASLATLTPGTGLTGSAYNGSIAQTFAVNYGSTAGSAVQGNTQITVNPGTGMSGGGTITLGSGGTVTLNNTGVLSIGATAPLYNTGTSTAPVLAIQGSSADQGSILYSNGSGTSAAFLASGMSGQVLQSNGTSAPTWVTPVATSATAWQLTGNSGTTAGTNFVGTTDNNDLVFKTAGNENMRIANSTGYVGINTPAPNSTLQVNGSMSVAVKVVPLSLSPYPISSTDYFIEGDCTHGAITVTLPDATTMQGRVYYIAVNNIPGGSGNTLTINTTGTQTIGNYGTSMTLSNNFEQEYVISDGGNWFILSSSHE